MGFLTDPRNLDFKSEIEEKKFENMRFITLEEY